MKVKFSAIFIVFSFLLLIGLVLAATFESSSTPTTIDAGLVSVTINFSVNNTETTSGKNITQVNITLPAQFTFVTGYNGTVGNSSNVTFSYDSTGRNATWSNGTSIGFIQNFTTAYFWFNVTVNKTAYGNYRFNISTLDTSGGFNSTNVTIFVERTVWSTRDEFYVKPIEIFLNLTNVPTPYRQNITIITNTSNSISIDVLVNDSSRLSGNYTQAGSTTPCQNDFVIVAQNTSGGGNTVYSLSPGSSTNFTLIFNVSSDLRTCKPGRYYTSNFVIRNLTNSTENLTIAVTVDLSISSNNSGNINLPYTGIASFNGGLLLNAKTYHLYHFNTSEVTNATSVYINISWANSSQDIDLFLFDNSGNLLAKSINKTGTSESLFYSFLPFSPTVYEIRLYGNSTSAITYNGNVIFSTLNSTNRTLNFEVRNVSSQTNQTFALNNTGNLTLSNVTESKDLYHVNMFSDNVTKIFTFLAPDSTVSRGLKVSLNWTGAGNYSLYLYNPSGTLIASSINKHLYANVSSAMREEYAETTSITKGVWRAEVKNSTPTADNYTLTIYQYIVNPSDWINTTYNTTTFNGTSLQNYVHNITVNITLTIPNKSMDGIYEGYVRYTSSANQIINLPVTINVTTPMLVVNNTIESETFILTENYGFNLTRSVTFQVNNTGFYDIAVNITNSSSNLTCNAALTSGCSGNYTNFTFNSFNSIGNYNYQNLTVNVTFNSSLPQGAYDGWIFINATGETESLSSHPYRTFNLTFRLNLTDALVVRTISATSTDGDNTVNLSSVPENVTVKIIVSYVNGTNVTDLVLNDTDPRDLSKNFTGVWLFEPNVSYRYPRSGSLLMYKGTDPIFYGGYYNINATIPSDTSGMPGGVYAIYVNVSHKRDSFSYSGYGDGAYITVNSTGFYMNSSTPPINVDNGSSTNFTIKIYNFGPLSGSTNIYFDKGTCPVTITLPSPYCSVVTGSCSNPGSTNVSFTSISGYDVSGLNNATWTITGSGSGSCTATIYGTGKWFNNISLPITVNPSVTTTTVPGEGGNITATTTTTLRTTTTTLVTTPPPVNETVNVSLITPAVPAIFNISNPETLKIQKIIVAVKGNVSNVTINVKESSKPSAAPNVTKPDEGMVLKYLEISQTNLADANISSVMINFQVEKSWVTANNIDVGTIAMYRYVNSTWVKLQTKKTNETSTYLYFQSISPGLSIFAIAGQKAKGLPWLLIFVVGGAIAVAVLAYLFWPIEEKKLSPVVHVAHAPEKTEKRDEIKETWDVLKKKWDELTEKKEKP